MRFNRTQLRPVRKARAVMAMFDYESYSYEQLFEGKQAFVSANYEFREQLRRLDWSDADGRRSIDGGIASNEHEIACIEAELVRRRDAAVNRQGKEPNDVSESTDPALKAWKAVAAWFSQMGYTEMPSVTITHLTDRIDLTRESQGRNYLAAYATGPGSITVLIRVSPNTQPRSRSTASVTCPPALWQKSAKRLMPRNAPHDSDNRRDLRRRTTPVLLQQDPARGAGCASGPRL